MNISVKGNNDTIEVETKNNSEKKSTGMKLSKMQKDMFDKLANIESTLTESDVNYLKNIINGTYSTDHGRRETPLNKLQNDILDIVTTDKGGYKLTDSQSDKGAKFLKQKFIYQDIFTNPTSLNS